MGSNLTCMSTTDHDGSVARVNRNTCDRTGSRWPSFFFEI
jgi:hypothetical protein